MEELTKAAAIGCGITDLRELSCDHGMFENVDVHDTSMPRATA